MIKLIETKLIKETYKNPILKIGDKVTWFDVGGSDEWGIIKAISPETDEYTVKWEDGSSGTYSRTNLRSEMEYYNWLDEEGLDESNSLKEFDDPKDNYDKQGNPRIPIYGHLNSEVVEMKTKLRGKAFLNEEDIAKVIEKYGWEVAGWSTFGLVANKMLDDTNYIHMDVYIDASSDPEDNQTFYKIRNIHTRIESLED